MAFHWRNGARDGIIAGALFALLVLLKWAPMHRESPLEIVGMMVLAFLIPFGFFVLVNGSRDPSKPTRRFWERSK